MNTITLKHSANIGDLIYTLTGIKAVCEKYDAKAIICQRLNVPAFYYDGATHPTTDPNGKQVMMNESMFNMVKPLIESLPFVERFEEYIGQKIQVDVDRIRDVHMNMATTEIRCWVMYCFPDMCADLGEKVFEVPPITLSSRVDSNGVIVVNCTERYRNHKISYAFLRNYPDVLFTGTEKEFELFQKEVPTAYHYKVKDFYQLAQLIASCKFFIGNQSMSFAIAEQMKVPRVLEVCTWAHNVVPSGPNGYQFLDQNGFEYYVEKLYNNQRP